MYNRCIQAGKIVDEIKSRKLSNGGLMVYFNLMVNPPNESSKNLYINVRAFGKLAEEFIANYEQGNLVFVDGYLWMDGSKHDLGIQSFALTAQFIGPIEHFDLFEELLNLFNVARAEFDERIKKDLADEALKLGNSLNEASEASIKEQAALDEFIKAKKAEKLTVD